MAFKELFAEYGLPVAVSITVGIGSLTISNSQRVAVLESETAGLVELQKEMVRDIKEINKLVYRIDATVHNQYGDFNE